MDEDQLSEKVIRDIFQGNFSKGSWLKQIELETRYNVSRTAVRRTLDALTARRYLEHVPNRGYRVAESSGNQQKELDEIRRVLEAHSVAGILANAPAEAAQTLRQLAIDFQTSLEEGTIQDQIAANGAFHEYFFSLSPNRTLFHELMEMRRRAMAMVTAPWSSLREMRDASRDHFDIVDAFEQGDLGMLRQVTAGHVGGKRPWRDKGTNLEASTKLPD